MNEYVSAIVVRTSFCYYNRRKKQKKKKKIGKYCILKSPKT